MAAFHFIATGIFHSVCCEFNHDNHL
jgi:hypothetical protein